MQIKIVGNFLSVRMSRFVYIIVSDAKQTGVDLPVYTVSDVP